MKYQDTMCEYDNSKCQSTMKKCSDKNCQENENIEIRPKKAKSHMWSMTHTNDIQLPKPAIKRLCNDRNCQLPDVIRNIEDAIYPYMTSEY